MSKLRNACITWNNPGENVPKFDPGKMTYLVFQKEKGEIEGTIHWQIYVEFAKQFSLGQVKGMFDDKIHVEKRRGTATEAACYCKKDETALEPSQEFGVISKQGERTDLNDLRDALVERKTSTRKICKEMPAFCHMYGRTLEKIEDIVMNDNYRTTMTVGVWYWGETGVGKSHIAMEGFTKETHYIHPINDKNWWDKYKQQKIVVINDFRGEISYGELLQLVDKWPYSVSRRCREPINFTSELVIITSPFHPKDVYMTNGKDKIEQLERRFIIEEIKKKT